MGASRHHQRMGVLMWFRRHWIFTLFALWCTVLVGVAVWQSRSDAGSPDGGGEEVVALSDAQSIGAEFDRLGVQLRDIIDEPGMDSGAFAGLKTVLSNSDAEGGNVPELLDNEGFVIVYVFEDSASREAAMDELRHPDVQLYWNDRVAVTYRPGYENIEYALLRYFQPEDRKTTYEGDGDDSVGATTERTAPAVPVG